MDPETPNTFVPPYNIPWATFLSAVEKISADPPNRVDRSYLGSQSGNVQTYLIAALKTFGLIDSDARPTRINEFADAATRKAKMADLLREHYPTLVALGQTKATNDELREKFGEAFPGVTGESRVKGIRFFLSGMSYAELPVSDLWSSVKAPRGASARTSTPRKPRKSSGNNGDNGSGASPAIPAVSGNVEVVTVDFGDAGRVVMYVDVRWLQLDDDTFAQLRKSVNGMKALATKNPASAGTGNGEKQGGEAS